METPEPKRIVGALVEASAMDPAEVPVLLPEPVPAAEALASIDAAIGPCVELAARDLAAHHARALEHLAQLAAECERLTRALRLASPADSTELLRHARGVTIALTAREEAERAYGRLDRLAVLVRRRLSTASPQVEAPAADTEP